MHTISGALVSLLMLLLALPATALSPTEIASPFAHASLINFMASSSVSARLSK